MTDTGKHGLVCNDDSEIEENLEMVEEGLLHPDDEVLHTVVKAIKLGISINTIYKLSAIDPWFLTRIKNAIELEKKLRDSDLSENLLKDAKRYGFSDHQIGKCVSLNEMSVRKLRQKFGIMPVVKQVDTLSC